MIMNNYYEEFQSLANIFKYFQNEIKKRRSTKIPKQILVNFLDRAKTGDLCRGLNMLKNTDGQGRTINFKNSIIVLTSNLGSQSINDLSVRKEDTNEIKKVVDNEIKKFFKPEFLNRLDEIVIFNNLELNDIKEIAKIQLQHLEKRLNKKNLKFKITDEAINQLVENSFDHAYGARPLKRIIQKQIETKISNNILNNHYLNKDEINIYLINGEINVD